MNTTLVGVFDEYADAQKACDKLEDVGIDKQSIQMTRGETATPSTREPEEKQGAIARFFSDLFGDDDRDSGTYAEAARRGHTVVCVKVSDEKRVDEVSDILEDCGAIDVDERQQEWKASGYVPPGAPQQARDDGERTLQAVEEELEVGKRTVQKGRVRVHTSMTETPVEEEVTLRDEKAHVERKKVDRPATEADMQAAFKEQEFEIRETSEVPVVSKTARVVEEVSVGKQSTSREQTVKDSVRSTKIEVDNLGDDMPRASRYSGPERRYSDQRFSGPDRRMAA